MKPMLASDADEAKIRYPVLAQPKIDGVRSVNLLGKLTGRSLKQHANKFVTAQFSHSVFRGMDGEMAAERETHPDLCRLTTSALNTIAGEPFVLWWLFDYVTPETMSRPYWQRIEALEKYLNELHRIPQGAGLLPKAVWQLRRMPMYKVSSHDELLYLDTLWLEQGYEGSIIRDPEGTHKNGRSTVREGGLLRIKRFVEEDAVVIGVIQGTTNLNEAKTNELGYVERSTHQENMVPNGQVGTLICRTTDGREIEVGPGKMPHEERKLYWESQDLILGKTIKYKHFPKGVKDKPRFPTFQSFRADSDRV